MVTIIFKTVLRIIMLKKSYLFGRNSFVSLVHDLFSANEFLRDGFESLRLVLLSA